MLWFTHRGRVAIPGTRPVWYGGREGLGEAESLDPVGGSWAERPWWIGLPACEKQKLRTQASFLPQIWVLLGLNLSGWAEGKRAVL